MRSAALERLVKAQLGMSRRSDLVVVYLLFLSNSVPVVFKILLTVKISTPYDS